MPKRIAIITTKGVTEEEKESVEQGVQEVNRALGGGLLSIQDLGDGGDLFPAESYIEAALLRNKKEQVVRAQILFSGLLDGFLTRRSAIGAPDYLILAIDQRLRNQNTNFLLGLEASQRPVGALAVGKLREARDEEDLCSPFQDYVRSLASHQLGHMLGAASGMMGRDILASQKETQRSDNSYKKYGLSLVYLDHCDSVCTMATSTYIIKGMGYIIEKTRERTFCDECINQMEATLIYKDG